MKRQIKIQFNATVFVTQTVEVDTEMTDEEFVAGLNGDGDIPVCTSLLKDGDVYIIPNQLKNIGTVVESDYDDGEFYDFELQE